jgi:hypothetical protein
MHFTSALIVAIVAVTGAQAGRPAPARPAPPAPVFNTQSIQCSSGAPYCCSPSISNTDNVVASSGSSEFPSQI